MKKSSNNIYKSQEKENKMNLVKSIESKLNMLKGRSTKYIKRTPKAGGGFDYVYKDDLKKKKTGVIEKITDFLSSLFGGKYKSINEASKGEYKANDIENKYNIDFATWDKHFKEYLNNKEKYDKLFGGKKEPKEKKDSGLKKKGESSTEKKVSSGLKKSILKAIYEIYSGKGGESKDNFETMPESEKKDESGSKEIDYSKLKQFYFKKPQDKEFEKVDGSYSKEFKDKYGLDVFYQAKNDRGWYNVVDIHSGLSIGAGKTKKTSIEEAEKNIEKYGIGEVNKLIENAVTNNPSPLTNKNVENLQKVKQEAERLEKESIEKEKKVKQEAEKKKLEIKKRQNEGKDLHIKQPAKIKEKASFEVDTKRPVSTFGEKINNKNVMIKLVSNIINYKGENNVEDLKDKISDSYIDKTNTMLGDYLTDKDYETLVNILKENEFKIDRQIALQKLIPKNFDKRKPVSLPVYDLSGGKDTLSNQTLNEIMSISASVDNNRYVYNGVYHGENELVATDGRRLFVMPHKTPIDMVGQTIHAQRYTPGKLDKMEDFEKEIIEKNTNTPLEGQYPNYKVVFPAKSQIVSSEKINVGELLNEIRNLKESGMIEKPSYQIIRKFKDKDGEEVNAAFNATYIEDAIKQLVGLGHKNVYFHFVSPDRPLVVSASKEYDFDDSPDAKIKTPMALIMPMRLKD